jgi:hypothetical protein
MLRAPGLARRAGALALPFLLAVALFAPSTVGNKVLSSTDLQLFNAPNPQPPAEATPANPLQADFGYVFGPDGLQVRDALRSGHLPTWTPLQSSGSPLLAQQQSAPLYPLTWLDVIFPYWQALAWIAVLKLGLAALGVFMFARALGLTRGASLVSGISFAFGSYMMGWLEHPHTNVFLLLGWLLLAAEGVWRRGRPRDAGWLALLTGLALVGGHPESAFIVLMTTASWVLYRLATGSEGSRLLRIGLILAGIVVGVGLAAVMLLPLRELTGQFPDYNRFFPGLPVKSAYSLFFPEWWGRPDAGSQSVGPLNFTERTAYVGALPLILAVVGFVGQRVRRDQLYAVVLVVVSLVVALHTPVADGLLRHVPGFKINDNNRFLISTSFGLALLAGFGCDAVRCANAAQRRRMFAAAAAMVVLPVLAVVLVQHHWLHGFGPVVHRLVDRDVPLDAAQLALAATFRWLVVATLGLAAIIILARWPRHSLAVLAVLAVIAVDLGTLDWGYNPSVSKRRADPPVPAAVKVMRRLTVGTDGRVSGINTAAPGAFEYTPLEPNMASNWGLADATGHEDPAVYRYERLLYTMGAVTVSPVVGFSATDPRTRRLLDLLGVNVVSLSSSALNGGKLTGAPGLKGDSIVYSGTDGVVVRNPDALPRAFVAYRWRPSSGVDASMYLMAFGNSRSDMQDPVIESPAPAPTGPAPPATAARIVASSDASVTIDARALAPGRLVLTNVYYPGWRATVDGKRVPILAADAAFQAVAVGKGRHVIKLTYAPASVAHGEWISLLCLVITLLALIAGGRPLSVPSRWARSRSGPDADGAEDGGDGLQSAA